MITDPEPKSYRVVYEKRETVRIPGPIRVVYEKRETEPPKSYDLEKQPNGSLLLVEKTGD